MLSAEAYSFRQQSRLAISLCWVAGYVNVVVFILTTHVISHVTGNVTFLGDYLAEGRWSQSLVYVWLIGTFLAGAVISAVLTEGARRRGFRSKYILPIALQLLLLVILAVMIHLSGVRPVAGRLEWAMGAVGSVAMGLQNATITRISGSIVRTTHLTGVVTDLGIEGVQFLWWYRDQLRRRRAGGRLGRVLRVSQRHPDFLRLLLLASIVGSFLFGVVAGGAVLVRNPEWVMVPPIAFLLWIILVDWRRPIADVKELDLVSDPELVMHGIVKALLPPQVGIYRLSPASTRRGHRAPSFTGWSERLPRHWRIVILAFSPLTRLDTNAILDLESAIRRLRSQRRRLIIAGLTPAQFRKLDQGGITDQIGSSNLCPDLEFAIARAMTLDRESRGEPIDLA